MNEPEQPPEVSKWVIVRLVAAWVAFALLFLGVFWWLGFPAA